MRKITFLLLLLIVSAGQSASAQVDNDAVITYMQRYFNFISLGQYASAYDSIRTGQSMYDYVAGFENTDWIQPYFGTVQTDETDIRLPVTLVSFDPNSSTQTFFGCIFLQDEGATYGIIGDNLRDMGFIGEPSFFTVADALDNLNCYAEPSIFPIEAHRGPGEAGIILRQYFDSISHRNYDAAYSMWLYPLPFPQPNGAPSVDYRPFFPTFMEGYFETDHIVLYHGSLNDYQFTGASAGSSYLDGLQAVVLVSQSSTGQIETFSGCYAMGRFTNNQLGIINGYLTALTMGAPTANQIQAALTIDCTTLGIAT